MRNTKKPRASKKLIIYKSTEFAATDSTSESEKECHAFTPGNQATNRLQSRQRSAPLTKNEKELQELSEMPPRPKYSTTTVETNAIMSKKRPLSPYAPSSVAKRPSTQGGFVLSSDDDDNVDYCYFIPSRPADRQNIVSLETPASTQKTLPTELTKGSFPTKQLNKARLNALLGRNGKLKQTTPKTLPSSLASQPLRRSMDLAANHELAELSKKSQENTVHREHSEKTSLSPKLGKSLLGVKQTDALRVISRRCDTTSNTDETKRLSRQDDSPIVRDSSLNRPAPSVAPHPQPAHAAIAAVVPYNNGLQQHKSMSGNDVLIRFMNDTKDKQATSTARLRVGINKEKGQRQFFPALKQVMTQVPTKFQSEFKGTVPPQLTASGGNPGSKAQGSSKPNPKIPEPQYQHNGNETVSKQQGSEVHSKFTGSPKPELCPLEQLSQKDTPDKDPNETSDITAVALKKPVGSLPSTAISPKIDRISLKSTETISQISGAASRAAAGKLSPPGPSDVTQDVTADASSNILVLSQPSMVFKDAQPYFEYSVFRKDWSNEQDENEAPTKEIIVRRFTNIHEANTQAEKLFQSKQQHYSYMVVECSTKRDEHGCMVLTSSIAPFDYPAHRHYTKIYVRRDCVSKFANQTPQSFRGTSFISDTGYILRLFRLIETSDTDNSDSSDSDSDSPKAVASKPIRAYHPYSRPEVYTTLQAANRAAKNLQIELSHERNPKDVTTKTFQEQDLRKLNAKVLELESAEHDEDRCWQSKFNASGLGGDSLELVVEKVGICGPRNV